MSQYFEFNTFDQQGFSRVADQKVLDIRLRLQKVFRESLRLVLSRLPPGSVKGECPVDAPFEELFDWCVANECDDAVSARCYEVFPTLPAVIGLINDEFILDLARSAGLKMPCASSVPVVRIDRPNRSEFDTPWHQDFWYSMLSPNSITIWIPVVAMEPEMGFLEVAPESHKAGLRKMVPWTGREPYTLRDMDESLVGQVQPVKEDECLVFSQLLLHRSGRNQSPRNRISIQVRLNDLATAEYPTSSFRQVYTSYVSEKQQLNLK